MSAEKTPEWLVDLLYVGEEEDEAGASPPELSDEERRQLDRSRALLREVREHAALAAPREATRASILEQARKAAAQGVADAAQAEGPVAATPARRDARAPREASGGLWSRSRTRSIAQIVAVALALVASAALLSQFQAKPQRAASFDPVAEMAANTAAPTTAAPMERPADTVALKEEAPAPPAVAEPQPDPSIVEMKPVEEQAATGAIAKNEADQQGEGGSAQARRDAKMPAMPKAPQEPLRALKDNLAGEDALGGYPKEEAKAARGSGRTVIASADEPSMLDGDGVVPMREREAPPTPQAPKTDRYFNSPESKADDAKLEVAAAEEMNAAPSQKRAEAAPSARPADDAVAAAPVRPTTAAKPAAKPAEPAQEKAADKGSAGPSATTPAAIRASYNRADYRGAISGADMFLGAGLGTPDQRAEIMDLKAQALEQLGRGGEADALLRELERQYPDYYRKNNLAKRKPAPAKKQKSRSIQFDEAASPDSAQSY